MKIWEHLKGPWRSSNPNESQQYYLLQDPHPSLSSGVCLNIFQQRQIHHLTRQSLQLLSLLLELLFLISSQHIFPCNLSPLFHVLSCRTTWTFCPDLCITVIQILEGSFIYIQYFLLQAKHSNHPLGCLSSCSGRWGLLILFLKCGQNWTQYSHQTIQDFP